MPCELIALIASKKMGFNPNQFFEFLHRLQHGRRPIVQVIRHEAILRVKQILGCQRFSHAHFSHATLVIIQHSDVSQFAFVFSQCITHGCRRSRYFPTGAMRDQLMLSRFDLHVVATVQALQIHARKIRILLVQIAPLPNSARLAREVRANELFAGISHLFFGFARNVKLFMLCRIRDSFDLSLGLSIVRIVCWHDYKVQGVRCQCQCRCSCFINFF